LNNPFYHIVKVCFIIRNREKNISILCTNIIFLLLYSIFKKGVEVAERYLGPKHAICQTLKNSLAAARKAAAAAAYKQVKEQGKAKKLAAGAGYGNPHQHEHKRGSPSPNRLGGPNTKMPFGTMPFGNESRDASPTTLIGAPKVRAISPPHK
jgi:hypothetical protein